jgi:hypothetical protein
MWLPNKRASSGIFAFGIIIVFSFLKHDVPMVEDMPFIAVFILLASIGVYFALTNDSSSIIGRISAIAVATAFSTLVIAFPHSFRLSSFRLATWTDVWSVSCVLIAFIGLWINWMSRGRHSYGEEDG